MICLRLLQVGLRYSRNARIRQAWKYESAGRWYLLVFEAYSAALVFEAYSDFKTECTTLRRKCCSLKAVPCSYPYPNSDEIWYKSILMGLSVYEINLQTNTDRIKDGLVIFDEVSFGEVS